MGTPGSPLRSLWRRTSAAPVSPEKKFLRAIDSARNDLVNKKAHLSGFDLLQHSPSHVSSRPPLSPRSTRTVLKDTPRGSIPLALSLSPGGKGKLASANREVRGLRFLSPRRANQEAVQSVNGSAQKIESLLGRANELQSQEALTGRDMTSKTLFRREKQRIQEKIQNKIRERIERQMKQRTKMLEGVEGTGQQLGGPAKGTRMDDQDEILQYRLRAFGRGNSKQTSVGMSFATNFESFSNFKTYMSK